MKKILFILTLLCTVPLFGMENPEKEYASDLELLPQEIFMLIMTSGTLREAISAIKAMSLTNKKTQEILYKNKYGTTKEPNALIETLAKKFNRDPKYVAYLFYTPAADKHIGLGDKLMDAVNVNDIDTAKQLISDGADVNYHKSDSDKLSPLQYATTNVNPQMIELLLNAGADPNFIHPKTGTALDNLGWVIKLRRGYRDDDTNKSEALLKKAMGLENDHR